mmetsp:Transcript_39365/g.70636  ORF Transcript_39365/g.70636 Transcript_39365/m.70636 type:complete len:82 (+) Transcript_39365:947-1192(+)
MNWKHPTKADGAFGSRFVEQLGHWLPVSTERRPAMHPPLLNQRPWVLERSHQLQAGTLRPSTKPVVTEGGVVGQCLAVCSD